MYYPVPLTHTCTQRIMCIYTYTFILFIYIYRVRYPGAKNNELKEKTYRLRYSTTPQVFFLIRYRLILY